MCKNILFLVLQLAPSLNGSVVVSSSAVVVVLLLLGVAVVDCGDAGVDDGGTGVDLGAVAGLVATGDSGHFSLHSPVNSNL